jgi:hypothetical protein
MAEGTVGSAMILVDGVNNIRAIYFEGDTSIWPASGDL